MDGLRNVLVRAIRHLESTAYEESLKGFGKSSLEERRQRGDVVMIVLKQREKKEAAVNRTKSHGLQLQLERHRADIRRHFSLVWCVQQETGLPSEVLGSLLKQSFGSALDKCLWA